MRFDSYPGASTATSSSAYLGYDEWGNVIYSRDAIGHEKFASYVNTRYQGGYYAPGWLNRTTGGPLFFDDFEDRDLSDWILDNTGGTVGLDAMFGGPISGASMNPARSIGPAIVSGDLHALWLYIAAPLLGASLGALTYQFIRSEPPTPPSVAGFAPEEAQRERELV